MSEIEQLNQFADNLLQEVITSADAEEDGDFRLDQFTQIAAEYLVEAGEIDDINVCYHKSHGMLMNGYGFSNDNNCLNLFVSIFSGATPPVSVSKAQCDMALKNAVNCLRKGIDGYYTTLEESSEKYDAFAQIHSVRDEIAQCRIYLLTDGVVKQESFEADPVNEIAVSFHVWDISRFHRFVSSGQKLEAITIDFKDDYGTVLPCLMLHDPQSEYEGYLAVIPGRILAGVYDKYGPRLLERNVRSFLQARGKVNKGIRDTIINTPHRFFAYNNGITATADAIEFDDESEALAVKSIRNLQIVNGGQTTASLYHAYKKVGADLNDIYVQAKLSVIPAESIDEIVPLISRFANSQNKVNDADFYANDPFHISIEEFSRTVWAPASGGTSRQTRWFYERARGQYLDAKSKEHTPARKRQFDAVWPSRQKFTKTDLAKYENSWAQLPHVVSLGAQKNFNDFAVRLKERGNVNVDASYFQRLIGKAILFKSADRIVRQQKFGGYKANIVTYTIAFLSNRTSQRIDLQKVWDTQSISPALEDAIREVSHKIFDIITNPPAARNITEWCKKVECWKAVLHINWVIKKSFEDELIDVSRPESSSTVDRGVETPNSKEQERIELIGDVPADVWFQISRWAKETGNLQPWQRGLAYSIGRIVARSGEVSRKQANQGVKILSEADKLGFKASASTETDPLSDKTERMH